MKVLYLDCFSGISGNMFLGGLVALGLPETELRGMLASLKVEGFSLDVEAVQKKGIAATHLDVRLHHHDHEHHHQQQEPGAHGHAGEAGHHGHKAPEPQHHHHEHRHLPEIEALLLKAPLPQAVQKRSMAVFYRLAEAEAKVHGTTPDKVHFHEVGAVDAIVDIVGTVYGLYYLGIEKIYASKVYTGSGFVECAHGRMPVPAPATAELLCGIPQAQGDIERELTTPTGAALLAELSDGFGALPEGFLCERIAYGAGGWDLPQPNVLRLCLGMLSEEPEQEDVILLEANLDDLSPQITAYSAEMLLKSGALDVWTTPVLMKKGRSGVVLSALCLPDKQAELEEIFFKETSTLGVRVMRLKRRIQARTFQEVETPWGKVQMKMGEDNAMPEYEDCRKLAQKEGIPLKKVQLAAWQALRSKPNES
nr:nickel pincer cofactor biosynthesis protein LarC [uncultured Anaeromusa sp.]